MIATIVRRDGPLAVITLGENTAEAARQAGIATAAATAAQAAQSSTQTMMETATTGTLISVSQGWDLYTRELKPGSNRFVKVRMQYYIDGPNLAAVVRVIGAWLCEKTGPDTFIDVHQILGNGPFEVLATETGKTEAMGTLQRQSTAGTFYYRDGVEVSPAGMTGITTFRTFEFMQRTGLYQVDSAAGLVSHRSRHIFTPDGFDYEFEYSVQEVHSLAHLVIGKLDILTEDGTTQLFDQLRRGPVWTSIHDLTGPVAPLADGSSVFKYSGPAGIGIELSIAPGTAWGGPKNTANVDADGRAWFDFHDAPYSPGQTQFSTITGTVRVRFGYNGE